ncbi:MAG: type II secretion system protein GspD [bacterium]
MNLNIKWARLFFSLVIAVSGLEVIAQESTPREIRSGETVTFDKSIPMKTALDILAQYSQRYEGKIIIDPVGKKSPIGVMVNNMYWKRALEYILRSNLLKYDEHEKYYEIIPLIRSQQKKEEIEPITSNTREVEINALFFEVDYQTVVEAGIDWSLIRNGKIKIFNNGGSEVNRNLFSAEYKGSHGVWDVFALLRTFESLSKGEVIANPQIKVIHSHEGKIKVGTNFFLTTRDFAGNTRFTEYESGIILRVTPTVIGEADSLFIHLDLVAERSDVTPDPVAVTKAITESRTQVLLLNGEETVIAGLFSNEIKNARRGIPILKDLPPWFFGLRYLFGFSSQEIKKKELVIILQATVLPTIAERIGTRHVRRNFIEQKRLEFKRKLRQLRTLNGTNGKHTGRNSKRRRR